MTPLFVQISKMRNPLILGGTMWLATISIKIKFSEENYFKEQNINT